MNDKNTIISYCNKRVHKEWNRLKRYRMEFDVTKKIFSNYFFQPPADICDIGGGPGRYSFYLSEQGYNVTLVDIAKANINYAKKIAIKKKIHLKNYIVSDATDLSMIHSNKYDIVLLMGPIYHLITENEREKSIKEAYRILRSGGIIIVSFVSRYERLRYLAGYEPRYLSVNKQTVYGLLKTGIMVGSTKLDNGKESFTTAYYAHPKEINSLMNKCNFQQLSIHGLEVIMSKPYNTKMAKLKSETWENWVDLNYYLSMEDNLLESSDHLIYVGKKNGNKIL